MALVEVDVDLVDEVVRRHGLASRADAVELALLRLLATAPMTREEMLAMRGSGWEGAQPTHDAS